MLSQMRRQLFSIAFLANKTTNSADGRTTLERTLIMLTNFTRNKSLLRITTLSLVVFSFSQLPASAGSSEQINETTVVGKTTALVGLARGDTLRYTAFNPLKTESGERNEPIRLRLKLYDARGNVIAESAAVEIPPGEFRFVDFNRDDLPVAGEPGTARAEIRTQAIWGFRNVIPINVTTSLEVVDSGTGATRYNPFITVEALP
jgi:hypothetical protein